MKIRCNIFQAIEGRDDFAFPYVGRNCTVDVDLNELVTFPANVGIWVIPDRETEAVCILKCNLKDFKLVDS